MLAFLDVTVSQRSPVKEIFVFQLLTGDIVLLEAMLPNSEFVSTLELGGSTPSASIRSITEFRNELVRLDVTAFAETEVARSGFYPGLFGTVNASDLRRMLVEAIDEALVSLMGPAPLFV